MIRIFLEKALEGASAPKPSGTNEQVVVRGCCHLRGSLWESGAHVCLCPWRRYVVPWASGTRKWRESWKSVAHPDGPGTSALPLNIT